MPKMACMTFAEIKKLRKLADVLHSGTLNKKKLANAARAIKRLTKNKRRSCHVI